MVVRGKFLVSLFEFLWLSMKFAGDRLGEKLYSAELRWLRLVVTWVLHTLPYKLLPNQTYRPPDTNWGVA